MVRVASIAMLLSAALSLGCAGEDVVARTELVLVADTDIAQLDQIEFDVRQGERTSGSGKTAVEIGDAPFTMVVVREEGSLGPLTARAIGYQGDVALVERSAVVSFSPGKTLTVVLHLVQSCVGSQCNADETCTERGCEARDVGALAPWAGSAPRLGDELDAGVFVQEAGSDAAPDLDGAVPEAGEDASEDVGAAGDPVWMNCGGGEVDISSDVNHCGRCDRVCRATPGSGSNVMPACVDGKCGVACQELWGDCDGDSQNGCENWLAYDSENCGACGLTCPAEEYCWVGECRLRSN